MTTATFSPLHKTDETDKTTTTIASDDDHDSNIQATVVSVDRADCSLVHDGGSERKQRLDS